MSVQNEPLLLQQVGSEPVVHDPEAKRLVFVNQTAADVWELTAEMADPELIVQAICCRYEGANAEVVRGQAAACLRQLDNLGLLGRKPRSVPGGTPT